jgi:hypothetical protein
MRGPLAALTTLRETGGNAQASGSATIKTTQKPKKSQISGYLHAMVMLFCFGILLGTTYTEQQPYVYSGSHQALMIAVKESQALAVASVDDVWTWIQDVVSGIGGEGIESINANCQYDTFNSQEVVIDGVTYTLGKPSYDTSSCDPEDISFVTGSMNEVYLTGNHQLLSFGIFSMRSVPQYPVKKSVKDARHSLLKVRSSQIQPLNPLSDDKIVEVCDANWGKCLHRDGFYGQAGSTFGWIGREVDNYYTFQEGSNAFMILPPAVARPVTVNPCYTYHEVGPTSNPTGMPSMAGGPADPPAPAPAPAPGPAPGPVPNRRLADAAATDTGGQRFVAQPGNPSWPYNISNVTLSNCEYKWVSTGYDIRLTCLSLENRKPTPLVSYLARRQGEDDVSALLTTYFGCNSIFSVDSSDMAKLYVTSDKCLESNILGDLAYGVFFSTANQDLWIRQSVEGVLQLQAHNYIDDNTRILRVYFITRSLGREQLFYTVITVEFHLNVDGSIDSSVKATYVPMIMFQYGYEGYEWRVKDVFRFEIMMLVIFVLFTLREIYQLITKRLVWLLPVNIRMKFIKEKIYPTGPVADSAAATGAATTTVAGNRKKPTSATIPEPVTGSGQGQGQGHQQEQGAQRTRGGIIPVMIRPSNYDSIKEGSNDNDESSKLNSSNHQSSSPMKSQSQSLSHPPADLVEDLENQSNDPSVIAKKPSELVSGSDRLDVDQLVEDVNEMVDEIGDAIEDMIDDYTPDSDEVHDMLDWATIAVITVAIIYRINYIKSATHLHTFLMNLEEERTYDEHVEQIVAKFAHIERQDQTIHLIAIAVIAIGMLQFFRYLSFNKRFGIVTTTIAASTSDLLPVLVIFVSIVIAYAVLASEIYGIQMPEYSTVQTSLAALFIVLLGNFDYYSSKIPSPPHSPPPHPHTSPPSPHLFSSLPNLFRSGSCKSCGNSNILLVICCGDSFHFIEYGSCCDLHCL